MGQEHCGAKRKDHLKQTEYSGMRLYENSHGLTEDTQGCVPNARHFLCQQDSIPFDSESKNMFHFGESSREPHGPANFCILQGNISVLHASRISHHDGAL